MELEYGELVEDKNNKVLGKIDYIVMDAWSGEQRKYLIRRDEPNTDVFFSPDQVAETTKDKVKLNVALEDLLKE